jgi:hypothetical protein
MAVRTETMNFVRVLNRLTLVAADNRLRRGQKASVQFSWRWREPEMAKSSYTGEAPRNSGRSIAGRGRGVHNGDAFSLDHSRQREGSTQQVT